MKFLTFSLAVLPAPLALSGRSSGPAVIPPELESQIDTSVSFQQTLAAPPVYSVRMVLLGRETLSAKRTPAGTQIEILQLPVSEDDPPAEQRSESQARFLAMNRERTNPAVLPAGTGVMLIGHVTGDSVQRLDESEYRYPTIEVKHLHMWEPDVYQRRRNSSSRVGIFTGVGFGGGGRQSGSFGSVGVWDGILR